MHALLCLSLIRITEPSKLRLIGSFSNVFSSTRFRSVQSRRHTLFEKYAQQKAKVATHAFVNLMLACFNLVRPNLTFTVAHNCHIKTNRSHQITNRSHRITNHSQQITNRSQQIQIAHRKFKSFTAN